MPRSREGGGRKEREPRPKPEDIPALSELELLGLDTPRYDISRRSETAVVSRGMYILETLGGKEQAHALRLLLKRHNLEWDVYDAERNPRGIFLPEHPPTNIRQQQAVFRSAVKLLGVSSDLVQRFFSAGTTHPSMSPAFHEALAKVTTDRETYAFRHLEEFPQVKLALDRIRVLGGPSDWHEIFNPGYVPPAFMWQNKQHEVLLDEALNMIAEMLSGEELQASIARKRDRSRSTVTTFLFGGSPSQQKKVHKPRLTDAMMELIRAKSKK